MRMMGKSTWKGAKVERSSPLAGDKPGAGGEKNWKMACKSVKHEENQKRGPRWSWGRNQTGNVN